MVGVGYGYDYEELGNTHFAFEDNDIIGRLAGIRTATPFDANGVERFLKSWKFEKPLYLRLSRFDRDNYGFQDHDNNDRYPKECGKLNYFINKYGTGFEEKRGE